MKPAGMADARTGRGAGSADEGRGRGGHLVQICGRRAAVPLQAGRPPEMGEANPCRKSACVSGIRLVNILSEIGNSMSVRKRIEKYRRSGGAADLVRVEVLVPSSARDDVLRLARRLRDDHRNDKDLQAALDQALSLYRVRILDNVDLDRLPNLRARARVVARAMIERGDARAFALGRELLSHAERV